MTIQIIFTLDAVGACCVVQCPLLAGESADIRTGWDSYIYTSYGIERIRISAVVQKIFLTWKKLCRNRFLINVQIYFFKISKSRREVVSGKAPFTEFKTTARRTVFPLLA